VDVQGSAATAMLGLPGFVLLAVSERDGELEQAVETTEAVTGCRVCGVVAVLHDRRPVWVRDLPSGGRPVMIVWVKRVWRCPEPGVPGPDLDRDQRAGSAAGVADRAGPGRGLPAGG
jgi:hypothetical protein